MTDDITKHKDWQKWFTRIYKVVANPQRVGASDGDTFAVSAPTIDSAENALADVAPLIFAAGREAEREEAHAQNNDVGLELFAQNEELMFAHARIAELETAQRWQPIESAPKDGQHFLAANFDGSTGFGWFNGLHVPARTVVHGFFDGFYPSSVTEADYAHPWPCTHWMPLPASPETGDK